MRLPKEKLANYVRTNDRRIVSQDQSLGPAVSTAEELDRASINENGHEMPLARVPWPDWLTTNRRLYRVQGYLFGPRTFCVATPYGRGRHVLSSEWVWKSRRDVIWHSDGTVQPQSRIRTRRIGRSGCGRTLLMIRVNDGAARAPHETCLRKTSDPVRGSASSWEYHSHFSTRSTRTLCHSDQA